MADAKKMTPKQKRFCEEYLVDLNATQAAIRAGYTTNRADAIGYENLRKPVIADEIARMKYRQSQRTQITADYVLKTIDNEMRRCADDPEHAASDVYKGAELLGKHLKLFTDRQEITGKDGAPLVVVGGPSMMDYDEWERKAKEKLKPSGSHN